MTCANHNPPVRNAVIAALHEHGPMTCHDLAEHLDWPLGRVQTTVSSTRRQHPKKIFRVVSCRRVPEGKGKDASVYAAQAGPDVQRKAQASARRTQAYRRYRRNHLAIINARARRARAVAAGRPTLASPWQQIQAQAAKRTPP